MQQDYDPCEYGTCEHGMASDCCACEIAQLRRLAEADDEEIVHLQTLLAGVIRGNPASVQEAERYLTRRGLR